MQDFFSMEVFNNYMQAMNWSQRGVFESPNNTPHIMYAPVCQNPQLKKKTA